MRCTACSRNGNYPTLSGANTARDLVEFPSQFNEHWALYPDVLKHYAVNYKTGEPMPQALVDKIKKSPTWNQGYELGELLAASELDMQWHELPADAPKQDVDAFETKALADDAHRLPQCADALPLQLFPAHLGERLCGGLLRLSVDGDARRRRLCLVRRSTAA